MYAKADEQKRLVFRQTMDAPVAEYMTAGYRACRVLLTVDIVANVTTRRWVQHEHGEE